MMTNDASGELVEAVKQHVVNEQPFRIVGGNSKSFLGCVSNDVQQQPTLSLAKHQGVVNYEPTELVFTARSGTPLSHVIQTLNDAGQQLPFDPPQLPGATLGGTLACGLSGPARPYSGSARDHMLGVRLINGQGEQLRFGGEVMKNVAGYDVSRVQVGAYGTLGVLLEASLKVLPKPETILTLAFEQAEHDTAPMVKLARQYLPITAVALVGTTRFVRLAGSDAGVQAAAKDLGGERMDAAELWNGLRDFTHPFFSDPRPTWRLSVSDYAPVLTIPNDDDGQPASVLYDWGGAQRWIKTNTASEQMFALAANANGHATRFSKATKGEPSSDELIVGEQMVGEQVVGEQIVGEQIVGELTGAELTSCEPTHQPLSGVSARLQSELRSSFDPKRLFNRGRFHPELDN